uniref:NB-ARC domain-containing protein n=1 Tax=Fagus sylvatica TaxID=28930 RepID=A0A2N9HGB4_FAGSY
MEAQAAISIGAKAGEYMVEPIKQQVGYLIHLNSNIKNLKDQFQKLGDKRHGLQLLIDEEKRKGQEILPEVNRWVENVDEISQGLQRFIDEDVKADKKCLGGWCQDLKSCYCLGRKAEKKTQEIDAEKRKDLVIALEVEQWVQMVDNISQGLQRFIDEDKMCLDLKSRYSLSRKAKKKTLAIEKLLRDAPSLNKMSCPPPPQGIGSSSIEGFKDFESRISMIKEVLEALRDDNINMIAICVVSQNQDLRKIQGQIADMLGLELKKESEAGRADQLKSRLMLSKSVLVILDDVWDVLNLEEVGIPYGGQHNRCKILLTSRSEEACNQMRSQKIVQIKVLSKEEAWNLFREMAEEHGFLVGCDDKMEEWPEKDTYGNYVAISLFSREMKKHPDGLECSKLELLQLSCRQNTSQTLPANMFQGMKELKVLSMRGMSFPSLPQSIQVLQNLRTLHLEYCGLEDVSAIGALGKLEMLSFLGSEIKELPREIGNLGHLKLLDLSECSTLERIPYGLLSSLSRLEELYMGRNRCEVGTIGRQRGGKCKPCGTKFFVPSFDGFRNYYTKHQVIAKRLALQKSNDKISYVYSKRFGSTPRVKDMSGCNEHWKKFSLRKEEDEKAVDMIKFPKLTLISLDVLPRLIDIVQRDGEEEAADFALFPKVSSFIVEELPNLVTFCKEAYSLEWSSMREIKFSRGCNKLKTIGSEIRRPRKLKEINRELDSRPQEPGLGSFSVQDSPGFLRRCLECVPHSRNYGPMVESNRGTNNKSHGSSSVVSKEVHIR